jgi:5,10-methylenetetrahydrofolate reductase
MIAHTGFSQKIGRQFVVNVEIVPPASVSGCDVAIALRDALQGVSLDGINIADSPMARARMSPLLCAAAIEREIGAGFEYIPHLAVRDRNRIATQGMIWGAAAAGIHSILIVSGDAVQYGNDRLAKAVTDMNVASAVDMAGAAGLTAGVVMDPRPTETDRARRALERKLAAGARFVITQPLYTVEDLDHLARATESYHAPVLCGILPLVSPRHARFLHEKVPEISTPAQLLEAMESAGERALETGIENARMMLRAARERLAGVCIMPPFNRFHLVPDILA